MTKDAGRMHWHAQEANAVCAAFGSNAANGLSDAAAQAARARYGANLLAERPPRPWWRLLIDQFADFMILVLIAAAGVSTAIGEGVDALAIVAIVVVNAVIGFAQQYRAQRALAALRHLAAAQATVMRDGMARRISAEDLVPGDIVLLDAGDLVPADLRLVEVAGFKTDEAALTGESGGIDKVTAPLAADLPMADRCNLAYKGTLAVHGRGRGVVVATGMNTELGRIAARLGEEVTQSTPLQTRLAHFGKRLALAALAICVVVFLHGVARGESWLLMFMTAVSLAVAAIPEALPAVVTVALALGARRMVASNALVRSLPAVETLGSVTVICSDKTGTLTQNRMHAEALYLPQWPSQRRVEAVALDEAPELFALLVLNNDARVMHGGETGWQMSGDPTETALLALAQDKLAGMAHVAALREARPRLAELPFDSDRKRMSTLHAGCAGEEEGIVAYVKGAPEAILPLCDGEGAVARARLSRVAEEMADRGWRVMALARRRLAAVPPMLTVAEVEEQLEFLGFVALIDPPRPEAEAAVRECRAAGIRPVMITGDHPHTALAIARRLGIASGLDEVLTGAELARMDDAELARRIAGVSVFARVDPEQKIRIVAALQAHGEVAAMTGDGVNDAPALRRADIGVAMGGIGTDVAREAAHMVLLDDNFASIVHAVREGRRIYDNIRKFTRFALAGNSGEILTIFCAPLFGLPLPLLPIHLLWVNLVTDGLPGLALALEPGERGLMRRPPRRPGESLFAGGLGWHVAWVGGLIAALTLGVQAWGMQGDNPDSRAGWQTMAFTVLTLAQMAHVLAIRSERDSTFAIGFLSNPQLLAAVALTFALQVAVVHVPWCNAVFRTHPLTPDEWAVCIFLASLVFWAVEVEKWLRRRVLSS